MSYFKFRPHPIPIAPPRPDSYRGGGTLFQREGLAECNSENYTTLFYSYYLFQFNIMFNRYKFIF